MGLRQMRQNRNVHLNQDSGNRVEARNQQLAVTSRVIGMHIAKQQAQMNKNALQCDTRQFYYFRRRSAGRLCSCMLGDENTPGSSCLVCFNTGYVGGYDKYGTQTEVIDITHPTLVMTNVHGNYDAGTRTTFFVLDDDARIGTIQATIHLRKTNSNYVDQLLTYDNAAVLDGNGVIDYMCREKGTLTWLQWNRTNVQNIVSNPSATDIEVCVYLKRRSLNTSTPPCFSHIYLRYGLLPEAQSIVNADIPKNTDTITLEEYGFNEQLGMLQMFMDNRITTYSLDDFFFYLDRQKFWKISEVTGDHSLGMYTSFNLTARHMQKYEIATQVPV